MQIYAISPERFSAAEIPVIEALLAAGLTAYHLRKPEASEEASANFLRQLPAATRSHIVLHQQHALVDAFSLGGVHFKDTVAALAPITPESGHAAAAATPTTSLAKKAITRSRSIHRIQQLSTEAKGWDYCFLSPVFPSISKAGYRPAWTRAELRAALERAREKKHSRICALGGIDRENALEAKALGFDAVVLCGVLWQSPDPVRVFEEIKEALQ